MNKLRIIIVEDEAIVARDIQKQLVAMGYEPVANVPTGEAALVLTGQLHPDLVLVDIKLAGKMDGIELAQRRGPAGWLRSETINLAGPATGWVLTRQLGGQLELSAKLKLEPRCK
jgi:hypothetical protein